MSWWDWDFALHAAGGAVVVGISIPSSPAWLPWSVVVALLVFGYVREKGQHSWERLSLHSWVEALSWPLGGLLVALPWQLCSQ